MLIRFWFTFDLAGLDGSVQYEWLVGGARLPIVSRVQDVAADRAALRIPADAAVGNPSWRGVWFPADSLRGPQ